MNALSIDNRINFKLVELQKWEKYKITWNEIVTVVSWKIRDRVKWTLKTYDSSIYYSWEIEAIEKSVLTVFVIENNDVILNRVNVDNEFWDFCRTNWKQLRELYDEKWFELVDLYRWDQIEKELNWNIYKFNLWFCWKEVDCLFHNQHNFEEIHTCIAWDWFMQKSVDWTEDWLVETVWLMPWSSHRKFNIDWELEENNNPKYPFHRWLWWNTWNIWLVIEKY